MTTQVFEKHRNTTKPAERVSHGLRKFKLQENFIMNKMKYKLNSLRNILLLFVVLMFGITGCTPDLQDSQTPDSYSTTTVQNTENSTFSIHFLDVGQADAALIECDGHYMLIDGGNTDSSSKMYTVLQEDDIRHLDIVVGTHADADHIGGLAGALNYATADVVLCSTTTNNTKAFENFKKYAEQNGNGIVVPEIGDKYYLGSSLITILSVNAGNDSNNSSIVLKLEYGDTSILFTGDAEKEAEQEMLDNGADLSADVLKVGHHGSAGSSSSEFLEEVDPEYAIISVGLDNSYSHPTEAALERLEEQDAEIYRTDLQGEITLTSDGENINISTEKSAAEQDILTPASEMDQKESSDFSGVQTDYILNTNTMKFHTPECKSVKRIHSENKETYYGTKEELLSKGYEACRNCNP